MDRQKDKLPLAHWLYALAYSGMYKENDWQQWAVLIAEDAPLRGDTEWVFDTVLAGGLPDLLAILAERMQAEYYSGYPLTDIICGYYYHRYRQGEISLRELLDKSGEAADSAGGCADCEFFYGLLNALESDASAAHSPEFTQTITDFFEPLCAAALQQKASFESATAKNLIS